MDTASAIRAPKGQVYARVVSRLADGIFIARANCLAFIALSRNGWERKSSAACRKEGAITIRRSCCGPAPRCQSTLQRSLKRTGLSLPPMKTFFLRQGVSSARTSSGEQLLRSFAAHDEGHPDWLSRCLSITMQSKGENVMAENDRNERDIELREWIESLNYVIEQGDPDRVRDLMHSLQARTH